MARKPKSPQKVQAPIEPMAVWRARRGMTKSDLARASGVSRYTIVKTENGSGYVPGGHIRHALADALGTEVELIEELEGVSH